MKNEFSNRLLAFLRQSILLFHTLFKLFCFNFLTLFTIVFFTVSVFKAFRTLCLDLLKLLLILDLFENKMYLF